jgi:hypothetical protein
VTTTLRRKSALLPKRASVPGAPIDGGMALPPARHRELIESLADWDAQVRGNSRSERTQKLGW